MPNCTFFFGLMLVSSCSDRRLFAHGSIFAVLSFDRDDDGDDNNNGDGGRGGGDATMCDVRFYQRCGTCDSDMRFYQVVGAQCQCVGGV